MKQEYASKIANELATYINKDTVDESIAGFMEGDFRVSDEKKEKKNEEESLPIAPNLILKIEKFKEIVKEYMLPQTLPLQILIDYNPPAWLDDALKEAEIPSAMNIFPWKTVISFNEKGERS